MRESSTSNVLSIALVGCRIDGHLLATEVPIYCVKAHRCLCSFCSPDFLDTLTETARLEARADYEESINTDAKIQLYKEALKRHRGVVEEAARQKIREEIKAEITKEVEIKYQGDLRVKLETE